MDAVYSVVFDCLPPDGGDDDDVLCTSSTGGADMDDVLGGGEDRISALPDPALTNILSRLPTAEAVRTQVLSRRWSPMWKRTPLVLDDLHLVEQGSDSNSNKGHAWRVGFVSRALIHHPGPFRSVRLAFTFFGASPDAARALRMWLRLLADKRVTGLLVLVNPSSPPLAGGLALPPDALRCCAALRRLYLAFFAFPSTKGCHPQQTFPRLREVVLCQTQVEPDDLSYLLRCSPALRTLALVASAGEGAPADVCVEAHGALCSLVLWHSAVEKLSLLDAHCLNRVVLWKNTGFSSSGAGVDTTVRLSGTPALTVLGFLDLAFHQLVIGDDVIQIQQSGTGSNPQSVPSVRVLALRLRFGDKQQSRRLAAYLRCFPDVDTLHVESSSSSAGERRNSKARKVPFSFWQKAARGVPCVDASVRDLFFHGFTGHKNEMAFLRFFLAEARAVQRVIIIVSPDCQGKDVWPKLVDLGGSDSVSEDVRIQVIRERSSTITFQVASDVSVRDPFYSMDGMEVVRVVELGEEEDAAAGTPARSEGENNGGCSAGGSDETSGQSSETTMMGAGVA